MKNQGVDSSTKIIVGVVAAAVIGIGGYLFAGGEKAKSEKEAVEHKSDATETAKPVAAKSGSFSDAQKKEIEDTVLAFVRDNSETFMGAIQEGMQKQQAKAAAEMVKTTTALKGDLAKNSITLGDEKAPMHVYAFVDPVCPHCHEFVRVANKVLDKTKDIQFHLIVSPMLGDDSVVLAKAIYAAKAQDPAKAKALMIKLIDSKSGADSAALMALAKDVKLDATKFDKDRQSTDVQKQIDKSIMFVTTLKIPGFPTVFVENTNGNLMSAPPMQVEDYVATAARVKAGEDLEKPTKLEAKKEETKAAEPKADEAKKEDDKKETVTTETIVVETVTVEEPKADAKKEEAKAEPKKAEKADKKKADKKKSKKDDKKAEAKKADDEKKAE